MDQEENNVQKHRRSIPIFTKKAFSKLAKSNILKTQQQNHNNGVRPTNKTIPIASSHGPVKSDGDCRPRIRPLQSLASSSASFAAGLRGKSITKITTAVRFVSRTPGPGVGIGLTGRKKKLKTPKSILKRRTSNVAKTTGHKEKILKDSTNRTIGNHPHVSLKLDFEHRVKNPETVADQDIENICPPGYEPTESDFYHRSCDKSCESDTLDEKTTLSSDGSKSSKPNSNSQETKSNLNDYEKDASSGDNSILSGIHCLSLDNSENLGGHGTQDPTLDSPEGSSTPESEVLNCKEIDIIERGITNMELSRPEHAEEWPSNMSKLQTHEVNHKRHQSEKARKTVSRSATFSSGVFSHSSKSTIVKAKSKPAVYNTGIRRYSDLKKSEEELKHRNAVLEIQLREMESATSTRINSLEAGLSELRGHLDDVEQENFSLREELEAKEKFYIETMAMRHREYAEENERLQEKVDAYTEKLILCKVDPVTLESMEEGTGKEDFIRARLEAKVQCKIFQQKLESFTLCTEKCLTDLMSTD